MSARANNQAVYMHPKTLMPVSSTTLWRVVLFFVSAVLLAWAGYELQKPDTLPIQKIHAVGTFNKVDEAMLRSVVAQTLDGGYFAVNVNEVKQAVENLPWVHSANVSRIWPDTLAISVVEEKAVAVWAKGGLVSFQGVMFLPKPTSYPTALPIFDGPIGMQRNMTEFYLYAKKIVETLGISIARLQFDSRGAIKLQLSNQVDVLLGREKTESRLERFVRVYKKVLAAKATEIASIDMRYSNGLAVGWRDTNKHLGRGN